MSLKHSSWAHKGPIKEAAVTRDWRARRRYGEMWRDVPSEKQEFKTRTGNSSPISVLTSPTMQSVSWETRNQIRSHSCQFKTHAPNRTEWIINHAQINQRAPKGILAALVSAL